MGHLADKIDVLDCLYEDEEMICIRDYNINLLDTPDKLKEYAEKGEKELKEFALNSDTMKDQPVSLKNHLIDFLFACNTLACEMAGTILFVYQKNKNIISASLVCDEMIFRVDELQTLLSICALASRIKFIPTPPANENSVLEMIFPLSENSTTIANLINVLKEYV